MATRHKSEFRTLGTGEMFFYVGNDGPIKEHLYRKSGPRTAVLQREEGGSLRDDTTVDGTVKVLGSVEVAVWTPDPTPSEIAARRLARLNNRIEEMVDTGQRAQREMLRVMTGPDANSDWYGVFSSSSRIEQQMKGATLLHVGLVAKRTLEHPEGGIEELTKTAVKNAMRYARFGHHSTSAVSNIAEEMAAAAWAEVAEACGWENL